jgi:hypothetical protein
MPLSPESPLFHHLATRWLDGVSTEEESAELLSAIQHDPGCAAAFAQMARFEELLRQTATTREQSLPVALEAEHRTQQHQHKRQLKRVAWSAAAAAVVITSFLWQFREPKQQVIAGHTKPLPQTVIKPQRRSLPAKVVMQSSRSANTDQLTTLEQLLADFFLPGLDFDGLPLQQAFDHMLAQLQELDFSQREALQQLRIHLAPDAKQRSITLRTGAISFLSAVRAVCAITDCESELTSGQLSISPKLRSAVQESRAGAAFVAAAPHFSADQVRVLHAGVLSDAKSLGMSVDDAGKIHGSTGQMEALALLSQTRGRVAAMQPVPLLVFPRTRSPSPTQNNRILTPEQTQLERQRAGQAQRLVLKPIVDELQPEHFATTNENRSDVVITVSPIGDDSWKLSLVPTYDRLQPLRPPLDAVIGPGQGLALNDPLPIMGPVVPNPSEQPSGIAFSSNVPLVDTLLGDNLGLITSGYASVGRDKSWLGQAVMGATAQLQGISGSSSLSITTGPATLIITLDQTETQP